MRLTADEILEMYPSMNMNGKGYDTVVARWYGDLPYADMKPIPKHVDEDTPPIIQCIQTVDRFVSTCYPDDDVYKYVFNHGDGFIRVDKDGNEYLVCGSLSVRYNSRSYYDAYEITVFNNHCGNTGFSIWRGDTGKTTIVGYMTEGFKYSFPTKAVRDTIDEDTIKKVFNVVKKSDDYGKCAKMIIDIASKMM